MTEPAPEEPLEAAGGRDPRAGAVARLYLIRHVEVELRDGTPPEEWLPTPAGLEAAQRLAGEPFVPDLTLVASSPEPKALATWRSRASSSMCARPRS